MNKNGIKLIVAVVCIVGAALAIMWNLGMIGGGTAPSAGADTATPPAQTDATGAKPKPEKNAPVDMPSPFRKPTR